MKKLIKKAYQIIPFKQSVYSVIKKVYTPPFYKLLPVKGVIDVEYAPSKCFKLHSDYHLFMENELFWLGFHGGWEKKSLELWIKLCENSTTIFDVGANSGIYSLISKSVNKNARVYAFEPIKENLKLLKANNAINHFDIKINEVGVSNKNGEAKMYALPNTVNYMTSINLNRYGNKDVVETIIPIVTLASVIEQNKIEKVDLIKIDVEEHEFQVLEGLGPYIKTMMPAFLIEIIGNENGKKIKELFENLNYIYFLIDEINAPRQVKSIVDSEHHNYLICTPDLAKKINLI